MCCCPSWEPSNHGSGCASISFFIFVLYFVWTVLVDAYYFSYRYHRICMFIYTYYVLGILCTRSFLHEMISGYQRTGGGCSVSSLGYYTQRRGLPPLYNVPEFSNSTTVHQGLACPSP